MAEKVEVELVVKENLNRQMDQALASARQKANAAPVAVPSFMGRPAYDHRTFQEKYGYKHAPPPPMASIAGPQKNRLDAALAEQYAARQTLSKTEQQINESRKAGQAMPTTLLRAQFDQGKRLEAANKQVEKLGKGSGGAAETLGKLTSVGGALSLLGPAGAAVGAGAAMLATTLGGINAAEKAARSNVEVASPSVAKTLSISEQLVQGATGAHQIPQVRREAAYLQARAEAYDKEYGPARKALADFYRFTGLIHVETFIAEQAGLDYTKKEGFKESFVSPAGPSRYVSGEELGDALQSAAGNIDPAEAKLIALQMENLQQTGELLRELNNNVQALRDGLPGGWGNN